MFASIEGVSNVVIGFSVQVGQPFQGREGMRFALGMPSTHGFQSDGTFWHVFGAVEEIAGRGDRETSLERIEAADGFEFLAERLAGPFEEQYVGFAVGHEFCLEIEDQVGLGELLGIPAFELLRAFGGHALGVVMFFVG